MEFDDITKELEKEKAEIIVRGPILNYPDFQIWGDIKIINFVGQPVSLTTIIDKSIDVGFNACLSGSAFGPPYPMLYRIDNAHENKELHQHEGKSVSNVETRTIGETLLKFFDKVINLSK